MAKDYGEKVFKKGKYVGNTYEQVASMDLEYLWGMTNPDKDDAEYLAIWKENLKKWLEDKHPIDKPQEETTKEENPSTFAAQMVDHEQRIQALEKKALNAPLEEPDW